jgi:pyrroline-5-carboxylate reductase
MQYIECLYTLGIILGGVGIVERLAIVGGGVMGEALLSRLLAQGMVQPAQVWVSDPAQARRDALAAEYGVQVVADNRSAAEGADVILLAIKPQSFPIVGAEFTAFLASTSPATKPLVISILAGTPLSKLEAVFVGCPVVRAMPNTPATVGAGVTAIAAGSQTTPDHMQQAQRLLASVGDVVEVAESLLDAVTGLSGSGPAYVALLVESLADGGVAAGLPRAIASKLALQTVLGTAHLLQASGLHPAELKDRVASPGGTTIAGVAALERAGFRSALIQAVLAASDRARVLGQ